jgi:outer membrane protein insertion porin family
MYYDLVERPSDQVELSGGWGGVFGFVGTLGLTFNNFSLKNIPHFDKWRPLPVGDGQRLSIRAQANGRQFQSYTFQFVEPWLGGRKPNSFSVNLNSTVQRNINAFTNQALGTLKLHSFSLGLGKRLEWPDNYFNLNTTIGYTIYQLDNWVFADRSLGFSDGDAHTMLLGFTLARNSVNNPMYPTGGSLVSLNATFTPPHSLWRDLDYENAEPAQRYEFVEYHKWMFDAKYYINLAGKLVMEAKAHFGVIGSYNSKVGVGPFERYTMGGAGLAGQNFLL